MLLLASRVVTQCGRGWAACLRAATASLHSSGGRRQSGDDDLLPRYPGASARWTETLRFENVAGESGGREPIPILRCMDLDGQLLDGCRQLQLPSPEQLVNMYRVMVQLQVMDGILYEAQRQGRISFYMTNYGEEASHVGTAAALADDDFVYGQYREAGVLMYRGYSLRQFVSQCVGNEDDDSCGRQMPVHYGSRHLHFCTISSPLATQMPQAVGTAYALARADGGGGGGGDSRCVACYFGEGSASEGDAHAAFNFAAVLRAPVLFVCRNNGYAISTPTGEQYGGDGVAARAAGYGMAALRVDGNDALAVHVATRAARSLVVRERRPVLLEAMTYRLGHHSTSDDSTAYRPAEELEHWRHRNHPIERLKRHLCGRQLWQEERDEQWRGETRRQVLEALQTAERRPKPQWPLMFRDVYDQQPPHLSHQCSQMQTHMQNYAQHYPS